MKRRVHPAQSSREPRPVKKGAAGEVEDGLGAAHRAEGFPLGCDGSARHRARVCWHPLRPVPRGAARTKVVPRHFPPSLIFIKDGVFLLPGPLRAGHIHPILQQRKEEEPRE